MYEPMISYGMTSNYFREYSPEEMVKCFSSKNWLNLELADEHGKMLLERGNPEAAAVEFKKYAEDHGVLFPQGHLLLWADIVDDGLAIIGELKKWLDLFMVLEIKAAVLHPGGTISRKKGVPLNEIRGKQVEALGSLTRHIKGTDLTICLENTPGTETGVEGLLEIIELSSSKHIGICLDTGHLNMAGGDQEKFVLRAGEHLKALHVHDNDGSSDLHIMPYGQGTVEWAKVIKAIKAINYKGLFNLEIGGEGTCPYGVKVAKLDYLNTIIPMMLS